LIREMLTGPQVKTHHGLEPLEDLGYPRRSPTERGAAVVIRPVRDSTRLPSLYSGVLVSVIGTTPVVAFAVVAKSYDVDSFVDMEHPRVSNGSDEDGLEITVQMAIDSAAKNMLDFARSVAKIGEMLGGA
jgi:hypothetical protein